MYLESNSMNFIKIYLKVVTFRIKMRMVFAINWQIIVLTYKRYMLYIHSISLLQFKWLLIDIIKSSTKHGVIMKSIIFFVRMLMGKKCGIERNEN